MGLTSQKPHIMKLVKGYRGSKRVTIPKAIVKELKLENDDFIAFFVEGNNILLKKVEVVIK